MTSRDKVLRAVTRRGPTPFPKHARPCAALSEHFRQKLRVTDLDAALGFDMRWLACERPARADLGRRWPASEFHAAFRFAEVARAADDLRERGIATVSSYECGTFEEAHALRGMDDLMVSLIEQPAATRRWLMEIDANKARIAAGYASAGVDIVFIGDDMGSQRALLVSEDMWSDFFRPPLERIIDAIREARPHVAIAYHSCGHIEPLVPALLEAGIDVLESVQPECNDVPRLVAAFHGRLAFWGCIGAQSTMARGTAAEVREAVLSTAALFPPGSGWIVAPAHTLEPDTPPQNLEAFLDAVEEADRLALPTQEERR